MAISPKSLVSWGLLAEPGGGSTQVIQVIQEMEIELAAAEALAVSLSTAEISVELRDDQ
jgi:hypothetical protein